jgi:hypothetical protein
MNVDEILRIALMVALGLGALYALLGGLMTRIGGRWRDGDRVINLRQFGPFVSGQAPRPGGWERYSGFALWGRVRLRRSDGGLEYLQSLGFAAEVAPLVEDQVMASFDLKLHGALLEGTFQGRIIRSERRPPKILSVSSTPPKARRWTRA